MTIIEAIKSGKFLFKRKTDKYWYDLRHPLIVQNDKYHSFIHKSEKIFSIEDLLRDDWEVREE